MSATPNPKLQAAHRRPLRSMSAQSVQLVRALYDAFARRDLLQIFGLLSPEIEIVQSEALPWGGTYRGHDGAREFFGRLTAYLHSTLELERLIDSGEHVTAIGWTMGKVNSHGATYRVPIAHIWHVVDGKIRGAQFLIDNPKMLAALAGRPQSG